MREALQSVRYLVDANGERTDAVVPIAAWNALIAAWKPLLEILEDQEDSEVLKKWLKERTAGDAKMVPLRELESELAFAGLL